MKQQQKGFTLIETLLVLTLVALIGLAGWYVWSKNQEDKTPTSDTKKQTHTAKKQSVLDENNVLRLASDSVALTLPEKWTYEVDTEGYCPMSATGDVDCIEGAWVLPDEKLPTIYGSGTEHFGVRVGVYNNTHQRSPQLWLEQDFDGGLAPAGDVVSHARINGYDAYFWKTSSSEITEINYVIAHENKVVYINTRTYEVEVIDGKTVGDFRKFEPQIDALVKSIKIN